MVCEFGRIDERSTTWRRRRVSQMAMQNAGRIKELSIKYRENKGEIMRQLTEAIRHKSQQVYEEVAHAIVEP